MDLCLFIFTKNLAIDMDTMTTLDNHKFTGLLFRLGTCQIILHRSELAHSHMDRHMYNLTLQDDRTGSRWFYKTKIYLGFSEIQVGKSVKQLFNLELPYCA